MHTRPSRTRHQGIARRRLLQASLAVGVLGAPAIARAQPVRTLRFGTPVPPDSTYGRAVAMFADEFAKLSGNKFKIDIYANSQLGSIKDMLTAVQLGTLSMAIAVPAWFAGFARQMDVFSLPFLVDSQERLRAALDGPFGARMAGFAGDVGFKLLGWLIMGPRQMANNLRPVQTPADLAGMKVRVISSPVFLKTFQMLGANPVGLDAAEMYLALQQHTVDGVENSSVDIVNLKLYEVSKYFSTTAHIMDLFGVAMNKALWDGMSAEEQGMAQQAMRTAMDWEWKTQPETTKTAVEKIKTAMQVNDLTPAEREKFIAATRPVYQQFEASIGKDLIDQAIRELGPA